MFKLCITGDLGFEVWQDIPGYEGLYQASTYGRARSLKRNTTPGKLLKPSNNKNGYFHIVLSNNGNTKIISLQRAVAKTFIPNPSKYPQVNHKNENKADNRVENLEWCSSEHNINYGTRNNRVSKKMTNGKLSKSVLQYDIQGTLIKQYPSTKEVEREAGYANTNISACCRGERKQAYGYIWKYA